LLLRVKYENCANLIVMESLRKVEELF
jgi:hypothetical protein